MALITAIAVLLTLAEQPDCAAFVVDAPGKTFRDALYPEYKANRAAMPDDLRAQVQPMCEIVAALVGPPAMRAGRNSGLSATNCRSPEQKQYLPPESHARIW